MHRDLIENREIRIFISSTFSDMQAERDRLVNAVFPLLRRKAAERDVALTIVDLRWGITAEESENGRVIPVCLDEIDRSRPFFIGLIGDRYGWVPDAAEIPDDCREAIADDVAQHRSITEMEFRYGVFRALDPVNAAFYIKADDPASPSDRRIAEFKRNVLALPGYPKSVYDNLDDLAEEVTHDFIEMLDRLFPVDSIPDKAEQVRMAQRAFMREKTAFYISNKAYEYAFDNFVDDESSAVLAVASAQGMGKSALMSHLAMRLMARGDRRVETFFATGHLSGEDILAQIGQIDGPAVVFVDSLDLYELDFVQTLLSAASPAIKIVVAAQTGANAMSVLQSRSADRLDIRPLSLDERIELITTYFARWSKRLDKNQLAILTADSDLLDNPSTLITLLTDIRTGGSYEALSDRISQLVSSASVADFYRAVLSNMDAQFIVPDRPNAVTQTLLGLAISSRPVPEDDLVDILKIPRLYLSQILAALDSMVAYSHDGVYIATGMLRDTVRALVGEHENQVMSRRHYMHWRRSDAPDMLLRQAECAYISSPVGMLLYRVIGRLDFLEKIYVEPRGRHDFIKYWLGFFEQPDCGKSMAVYVEAACCELEAGISDERRDFLGRMFMRVAQWLLDLNYPEQLRIIVTFLTDLLGEDDETVLQIQSIIAVREHDYALALRLMHSSLSDAVERYGSNIHRYDRILCQIADVYNTAGETENDRSYLKKAAEIYKTVLDDRIKRLGENHREVALVLDNLAGLMGELGNRDLENQYRERSMQAYVSTSGINDDDTAQVLFNAAAQLFNDGDRRAAGKKAAEALKIYRRMYGDAVMPSMGKAAEIMAAAEAADNNYDRAAELVRYAEPCVRAGLDQDPEPWKSLAHLQSFYLEARAASDVLRLADEIESSVNGADQMRESIICVQYIARAQAYAILESYDEAIAAYDRARELAETKADSYLYVKACVEAALLMGRLGRLEQAEVTLTRLVDFLVGTDDTESDSMAYGLYNRSQLRFRLGRRDEALADIEAAIALRRRLHGDDDTMLNKEYLPTQSIMLSDDDKGDPQFDLTKTYYPVFTGRVGDEELRREYHEALEAFDHGFIDIAMHRLEHMRMTVSDDTSVAGAMIVWLMAYCTELSRRDDAKAESLYRSALSAAEENSDMSLAARIGHDMCEFFWNRKSFDKAWPAYLELFRYKHLADDFDFRNEYISLYNAADAALKASQELNLSKSLSIIVMYLSHLNGDNDFMERAQNTGGRALQALGIDIQTFSPNVIEAYDEALGILAGEPYHNDFVVEALAETALNLVMCNDDDTDGGLYMLGMTARYIYGALVRTDGWNRLLDMTAAVGDRLAKFPPHEGMRDMFVKESVAYSGMAMAVMGAYWEALSLGSDIILADADINVAVSMLWSACLAVGADNETVRSIFDMIGGRSGDFGSLTPMCRFMYSAVAERYDTVIGDQMMSQIGEGLAEDYFTALYDALTADRHPATDGGERILEAVRLYDMLAYCDETAMAYLLPMLVVLRITGARHEFDQMLSQLPGLVYGLQNGHLQTYMIEKGLEKLTEILK